MKDRGTRTQRLLVAITATLSITGACNTPRDEPAPGAVAPGRTGGTTGTGGSSGAGGSSDAGGGGAGGTVDSDAGTGSGGCGSVGRTRCAGSAPAVEVCTLSGEWMMQKTCPAMCSDGACAGSCVEGDMQCGSGQTSQACRGGQWVSNPAPCPFVCTGKGACTGECMPGTKKCGAGPDSLTAFQCDEKGMWQKATVCQNLCSSGSCAGSCMPGKTQCAAAGNGTEVCSMMGTWERGEVCQNKTCVNGACAGSCEPKQTRCGGADKSQPQQCDDSGNWVDGGSAVCCGDGPGQKCCDGHMVTCMNNCGTAGKKTCAGGSYGKCSTPDTCCADPTCRNKCGDTGTRTCNGTTFSACPVKDPACCPPDTQACKNKCGIGGNRQCENGKFPTTGCSSDSQSCAGREGFECNPNGTCNSGLFCCNVMGFCPGAKFMTCQLRLSEGQTPCNCDGWCKAGLLCSGDEDNCIADPTGTGLGQPCQ